MHIRSFEYAIHFHQSTDRITNRCSLWSVNDACVWNSGTVESKKISILCNNNTALARRVGKLLAVRSADESGFERRFNITSAPSEAIAHGTGNVFIGVPTDRVRHDVVEVNVRLYAALMLPQCQHLPVS